MAHFAELDLANIVLRVLVIDNSEVDNLPFPNSEPVGIAYMQSLFGADTIWRQTSYNSTFRYNFCSEGFSFDASASPDGAFIALYPGEGWILDTTTYKWVKDIPINIEPPTVI
jgi:hypothetical protein